MTLSTEALAPSHPPTGTAVGGAAQRQSLFQAHVELGKVRLNAMVVFTTALGFVVGTQMNHWPISGDFPAGMNWGRLLWTCVGTFLAAVGASAFNQAIEARRDARMRRTCRRPVCTGRLSRTYAAALGLIVSMGGAAMLWQLTNGLTAALAAGNILLYVIVYTPLKPVSTVNTLVGAVVGAVPPVLGWTAATGELAAGAMALGGILWVWQIPHFLALCWMYREDYARGGFKMLPIGDATGRLTSRVALIYAVLLMPVCLLVAYLGNAGMAYAAVAFVLTLGLIAVAWRFAKTRANGDARRLFFASIIYLPILCTALMLDARGPLSGFEATPLGLMRDPNPRGAFVDPGSEEGRRINAALATQRGAKP